MSGLEGGPAGGAAGHSSHSFTSWRGPGRSYQARANSSRCLALPDEEGSFNMSDYVEDFRKLFKRGFTQENSVDCIRALQAHRIDIANPVDEVGGLLILFIFTQLDNVDFNVSTHGKDVVFIPHGGVSINATKIGGGSFGEIFLDEHNNVWKKQIVPHSVPIHGPWSIEEAGEIVPFVREFLIEALIQTILQKDEKMGKYIAKINKIYVSSDKKYFFYKMEKVPYTFEGYVEKFGELPGLFLKIKSFCKSRSNCASGRARQKKYLSERQLSEILLEISTTLKYFFKKYKFHHRDLHCGNVMFDEDKNIKIIDFGMSSISKGTTWAKNTTYCGPSYDLAIYVTSLYQFFDDYYSQEAYNFLYNLMEHEESIKITTAVPTTAAAATSLRRRPASPVARLTAQNPSTELTNMYEIIRAIKPRIRSVFWCLYTHNPVDFIGHRYIPEHFKNFTLFESKLKNWGAWLRHWGGIGGGKYSMTRKVRATWSKQKTRSVRK